MSTNPTARADQVAAASRDVMLTSLLTAMTADHAHLAYGIESPRWVTKTMRAVDAARAAGRLYACEHLGSPAPVLVWAWNPTVLRCMGCALAAGPPALSDTEELTCDECGHVDSDHIHHATATFGPVLFVAGLCCECIARYGTDCEKGAAA